MLFWLRDLIPTHILAHFLQCSLYHILVHPWFCPSWTAIGWLFLRVMPSLTVVELILLHSPQKAHCSEVFKEYRGVLFCSLEMMPLNLLNCSKMKSISQKQPTKQKGKQKTIEHKLFYPYQLGEEILFSKEKWIYFYFLGK